MKVLPVLKLTIRNLLQKLANAVGPAQGLTIGIRRGVGGSIRNGEADIQDQTRIVARLGRPLLRGRRSVKRTADPRIELHNGRRAGVLPR